MKCFCGKEIAAWKKWNYCPYCGKENPIDMPNDVVICPVCKKQYLKQGIKNHISNSAKNEYFKNVVNKHYKYYIKQHGKTKK